MSIIHGADFIYQFFGVHNLLRATVSEHPIFNVWYYYFIVFFIGFLPFSFAILQFKPIRSALNRFLFIWALTVFVVFQLAATKYPTYTFPYIIPLSILFAQFINPRLIFKLAAASALFLFIANFAAIPIIARNSAKSAANFIPHDYSIVSFRKFYPGSLTFYTGLTVYRLETDQRLAELRPNNTSWTAVNVMPFISFSELIYHKKIIALIDNDRFDEFIQLTQRNWRILHEFDDYKIVIGVIQ